MCPSSFAATTSPAPFQRITCGELGLEPEYHLVDDDLVMKGPKRFRNHWGPWTTTGFRLLKMHRQLLDGLGLQSGTSSDNPEKRDDTCSQIKGLNRFSEKMSFQEAKAWSSWKCGSSYRRFHHSYRGPISQLLELHQIPKKWFFVEPALGVIVNTAADPTAMPRTKTFMATKGYRMKVRIAWRKLATSTHKGRPHRRLPWPFCF